MQEGRHPPLESTLSGPVIQPSGLDDYEPVFPPPITSRERLYPGELFRALRRSRGTAPTSAALAAQMQPLLPADRVVTITSQGKAAFDLIVQDAGLAGRTIILPAFFPDDFVGIFRKYGIRPRFVDVNPNSYEIDVDELTPEVLDGASAIVVEHTFGRPAATDALRALCDARGILLIEDCARALGAGVPHAFAGHAGDYAAYSLSKIAPVRQGGAVLSRHTLRATLAPAQLPLGGVLASLMLLKIPALNIVEGLIYRFAKGTVAYPLEVGNYQAAPPRELDTLARLVLGAYLPAYPAAVEKRRSLARTIRAALEPWGYRFQADAPGHVYTALSVQPPPGLNRDALRRKLRAQGVKAAFMWDTPLSTSDIARDEWGADRSRFPVAAALARNLIQLPISRYQTALETERIVQLCRRFAEEATGTRTPDDTRD